MIDSASSTTSVVFLNNTNSLICFTSFTEPSVFFRVTLDEIKKVVEENHDKTVDFINTAEAEQYRESEMLRKRNNI